MSRLFAPARALVVVLCAAALGPPAAGAAVPASFYTPPSPLPAGAHGSVIRSRPLTGAAVVPGASKTTLVLYRSADAAGHAVAVSGVVSLPKGKAPRSGWPIITYAHGTTGIADQCAPSLDVAGTAVHPYNAYVFPLLQRWLKAGYAVVRTDYQGLGTPGDHQYLIGASEGRSVLDMARAARALAPGKLSKDIIISGHSQGGHAALFAAAEAAKWTPDLKLRGTVAFAPASHLGDQLPLTSSLTAPGGGLTGLIADILRGLQAGTPSFDATTVLGDAAAALYPQTLTQCLPALGAATSFGGLSPKDMFKPGADLGPIAKLLDAQDPSHLTIRTPLLIAQGSSDTTVIPLFTDQLATELKDNGTKDLTYDKVAGIDHAGIVTAAAGAATTWIAKRLR